MNKNISGALIAYEADTPYLPQEVVTHIVELERDLKAVQEQEKMLRQALLKTFEHHGITSLKTDEVTVTYIPETTRESFDTKAFRGDFAELYDDYVRISTVAPTLKITVK